MPSTASWPLRNCLVSPLLASASSASELIAYRSRQPRPAAYPASAATSANSTCGVTAPARIWPLVVISTDSTFVCSRRPLPHWPCTGVVASSRARSDSRYGPTGTLVELLATAEDGAADDDEPPNRLCLDCD